MPAADRLHCGSGAFQSDHIQSMTNGQAGDSNKLFNIPYMKLNEGN
jgi:hypothetical protein